MEMQIKECRIAYRRWDKDLDMRLSTDNCKRVYVDYWGVTVYLKDGRIKMIPNSSIFDITLKEGKEENGDYISFDEQYQLNIFNEGA